MRSRRAACVAAFLLVLCAASVCGGGGPWHGGATRRWATPSQEAEDERHDAEIFRAVVSSMAEWNRRNSIRRDVADAPSLNRQKRAAGVCYPEVGCFSDSGVFGYLDMLPSPPEEVGTRFLVYGSGTDRSDNGEESAFGGAGGPLLDVPFANYSRVLSLTTPFDPALPTKIIVHGFGSSCSHVWVYEMRSALMAVEACNVICVDWEGGATVPNYVRAAANTRLVGKQLALLLRALSDRRSLDPTRVHLIGFSLGAHVAGFAGAEIRNLSRITGLDPAGPLFEGQDPRARLDATDATFVDVIHSNGENLILGGLGSWQPMGHVDFYPNGGRMQKGCSNIFVGAVSDILWSASDVEGRSLCNHRRAYKFFTDSVSPRCQFPAFPCSSYDDFIAGTCFPCSGDRLCGNMGYYADRSAGRGVLFLVTRDEEPFCAHQYFVRLESATNDPADASSYGSLEVTLAGDAGLNETFALTQKRDEQLRPGQSLQRLLVPHPALAEPERATLLYTAYAGWWSSGLPAWPVRKLALVDSFGKSMSVCQRNVLLLRSGEPMTLQLYPGECNPPPSHASNITSSTPPSKNPSSSSSTTTDAPLAASSSEAPPRLDDPLAALLAGAPVLRPWPAPSSEGESAGNSLEDSRAFHSSSGISDAPLPQLPSPSPGASAPAAPSSTSTAEPLPDIREPVLTPRNSTLLLGATPPDPDGAEADAGPRRDIRVAGRFSSEDDTRLWIPAAELNPPPLGGPPVWRHWTLARAAAAAMSTRRFNDSRASPAPGVASRSGMATVQLLPQRLATLLTQAERSTWLGAAKQEQQQPETANPPRQRTPKVFGEHPSSSASPLLPAPSPPPGPPPPTLLLDARGAADVPLVALAHGGGGGEDANRRFIPLKFPDAPRRAVTVTPDRLRTGYRSVKIHRSDGDDIRNDDRRPVYRPDAKVKAIAIAGP